MCLETNSQKQSFYLQASTYLSADLLLREDPEESLEMVKMVIKVFRCFRESYQTQRDRLANHAKHAPWDFPSAMIFAHFNQFLNRMLQLEVKLHFHLCIQMCAFLFFMCFLCGFVPFL